MRVHFCPLDSVCRSAGAPWRLHISTRTHNLGLAVTPGSRFADRRDAKPRWIRIVRHPKGAT